MPIGLPNCWRVFVYSVEVSRTFCTPPTISAHNAAVAHSRARFRRGQALSGAPITASAGSCTPSKRTSLQRRVISSVSSGLTVRPLGRPLTRKRGAAGFLEHDDQVEEGADAAVLLRYAERRPAQVGDLLPQRLVVAVAFHQLAHDLGAALFGQELARRSAQHLLLLRKREVH